MSTSIYTNTGIVESSWNSRGLVLHNGVNKSLIRQDNGILWAAVRESHVTKFINIYKSTDDGFSWKRMWFGTFSNALFKTGLSGLNINGPVMHLTISESRNKLILWHSYYHDTAHYYNIEPMSFDITDNELIKITSSINSNEYASHLDPITDQDDLMFDVSYTNDMNFITYVSLGKICVKYFNFTYILSSNGGTKSTTQNTYFNLLSTYAKDNNKLHVLCVNESSNYQLHYLLHNRMTGTFSDPVIVTSFSARTISDLNIAQDGFGTLCAYWTQLSVDDNYSYEYYSLSYNDGLTWTAPFLIPLTFGQYNFTDQATNQKACRTVLLSGLQGFMLGYTRNVNSYAKSYVRLLKSETGNEYILEDEKIAASKENIDTVGIRFFLPPSNSLINLNNPGEVRIGYSQGQSTSTTQTDSDPSYFGQKLLNDEAYSQEIIVEYEQDFASSNELLFTFNLLGSTSGNVDYYEEGLIGNLTKKYKSAFDRIGTSVYLERYEPIKESQLSDKSAYLFETGTYVKAFVDEVNYSFPIASGTDTFKEYIERDTRTVHLPPSMFLNRNFLINNGNYLKRTVWIMQYAGNQYELSQLVPKFVDNQILYYTVNAYVVGPSRNPFTRLILPSET